MSTQLSRLLFLCTGNYYRSRFAELLFNARVEAIGLNWVAESRGIAIDLGINNVGPMAASVSERLAAQGIAVAEPVRFPLQVREENMHAADLIIALDEQEHRRLLQQRYPDWPERVSYWQVNDTHLMAVDVALASIEHEVERLIERVQTEE